MLKACYPVSSTYCFVLHNPKLIPRNAYSDQPSVLLVRLPSGAICPACGHWGMDEHIEPPRSIDVVLSRRQAQFSFRQRLLKGRPNGSSVSSRLAAFTFLE